jgi:hypothetical protein
LLVKHAARAISQAAKKVKAFEAMTIARSLKQRREKLLAAKDADADATAAKVAALEASSAADLARVKGLGVWAVLLPRALSKLGLDAALLETTKKSGKGGQREAPPVGGTAVEEEGDSSDSKGNEGVRDEAVAGNMNDEPRLPEAAAPEDPIIEALVSRLLNHAAMKAAVESMNPMVTLRRREKLAKAEGRHFSKKDKGAPEPGAAFSTAAAPAVNHRAARTTFLSSLSGDPPAEESGGSDDDDDGAVQQPKNRPGQRARQKRHEVEEARKVKKEARKRAAAGLPTDRSQNLPPSQRGINPLSKAGKAARHSSAGEAAESERWGAKRARDDEGSGERPKKKRQNAIHASWEAAKVRREKEASMIVVPSRGKKTVFGDDGGAAERPASASHATPRAAPKGAAEAEEQHPSWAAKQAQKTKMAASFQGKKTTFD